MIRTFIAAGRAFLLLVILSSALHGLAHAQPRVHLTVPNGSEQLRGWDSLTIRWDGIDATSAVNLDYSSDRGSTWFPVADGVRGLAYRWIVPNRSGNDYLVRVRQSRYTADTIASLAGHRERVNDAVYSHDGTLIATASSDNTARIWNVATGKSVAILLGHTGDVYRCAFSPDDHLLVTASQDRSAIVWDVETGEPIRYLTGHTRDVVAVGFSPDGSTVVTGSEDGTLRLWSTSNWGLIKKVVAHFGGVASIAFTDDGTRMVTGGRDWLARIWSFPDMEQLAFLPHINTVLSARYSHDGLSIVTGCGDSSAYVWSTTNLRPQRRLRGHANAVTMASFNGDGSIIATTSRDGTIKLWDATSGDLLSTLHDHHAEVASVAFAADKQRLLTAGNDGTALLWQVAERTPGVDWSDASFDVTPAALHLDSPNGGERLSAGKVVSLRWSGVRPGDSVSLFYSTDAGAIWTPITGDARGGSFSWHVPATPSATCLARVTATDRGLDPLLLNGSGDQINGVAISHDGRLLAAAASDGRVLIWNAATGAPIDTLRGHSGPIMRLAFDPHDSLLVTVGRDSTMRVWDVAGGGLVRTMLTHSALNDIEFSRDGTRLVTVGEDGYARVYTTAYWSITRSLRETSAGLYTACFTADGASILSGGRDSTVRMWNIDASTVTRRIKGTNVIHDVRVSPDGKHFITACRDGIAREYGIAGNDAPRVFAGHTSWVWRVSYSLDGQRIATIGRDGVVLLWDAVTGERIATLAGPGGELCDGAFSSDGAHMLIGGRSAVAELLDLTGDVLASDRSDAEWTIEQSAGLDAGAATAGGVACAPNPMSASGHVQLDLPEAATVHMRIVSTLGVVVRDIDAGRLGAGRHAIAIDVSDLSSGGYRCIAEFTRASGVRRVTQALVVKR